MAETLLLNKPFVTSGIDTLNYTIAAAGLYYVQVQLTEVPPSGLSVLVKQNGSTVFTAPALSPTQIAQQFKVSLNCALNDVISVVIASSTAIDLQLNNVKSTVTIGQGM